MQTKLLSKIGKEIFILELAKELGVSENQSKKILAKTLSLIEKNILEGYNVTFSGFGTFKIITRKARSGFNLKTKERTNIKETKNVKFVVGKPFKKAIRAINSANLQPC